jgi:hypothetical protein
MRWMAPELIDPDRFGLPFRRTTATDVYAFACVCLEVIIPIYRGDLFTQRFDLVIHWPASIRGDPGGESNPQNCSWRKASSPFHHAAHVRSSVEMRE